MTTTSNVTLTEKVSVNINTSTLAAIDLLVDNGYYSNRSDFINQALREALHRNETNIARCSQKAGENLRNGQWFMGVGTLTLPEVEEILKQGRKISISGYGLLCIKENIPPEKLFEAVGEIQVKGRVLCPPQVAEHYGL